MRERYVGTVSRGIRAPVIRAGDDIVSIVVDSVVQAAEGEGFALRNRDIVAITEAVIARAQDNYATLDEMAADLARHFDLTRPLGIVFPILSRNRFAVNLRAFARACSKIVLRSLSRDEVGHAYKRAAQGSKINLFGSQRGEFENCQPCVFAGIDYIEYYRKLFQERCELRSFWRMTHGFSLYGSSAALQSTRLQEKLLGRCGDGGRCELMREPVNISGYNPGWLLGVIRRRSPWLPPRLLSGGEANSGRSV